MSDTPKFEVIDRRKMKAQEEQQNQPEAPAAPAEPEVPSPGPRLVVSEPEPEQPEEGALPPLTEAETSQAHADYNASAQRLEDLIRAQNPGAGAPPPVTFESLVQQFYLSSMIQMGAGTPEGQRPRIDIMGARTTIDLLGVLQEKTSGNLSEKEAKALETVLFEVRMAFLELTRMISMQAPPPPPPPQR